MRSCAGTLRRSVGGAGRGLKSWADGPQVSIRHFAPGRGEPAPICRLAQETDGAKRGPGFAPGRTGSGGRSGHLPGRRLAGGWGGVHVSRAGTHLGGGDRQSAELRPLKVVRGRGGGSVRHEPRVRCAGRSAKGADRLREMERSSTRSGPGPGRGEAGSRCSWPRLSCGRWYWCCCPRREP